MSLSKDRQGYLDDLSDMTVPQLKELLERQENILSKKKFLANLPDKGEKSKTFAEKLRNLIADRTGLESERVAADCIFRQEKDKKLQEKSQVRTSDKPMVIYKDEETLEALASRNETDTVYNLEELESCKLDTREYLSHTPENSDDLSRQMQELSVGNEHPKAAQHQVNGYKRVIKKAELSLSKNRIKFVPNRCVKSKSSILASPSKAKREPPKTREESAVCPPPYNYEATKLISIEESVQLIEDQKKRTEQLAAERAAQRLAEQLTPKMEIYQPLNVDMSYRQREQDNDEEPDSDDFPTDEEDDEKDDESQQDL